ncbi:M42 family metallopeptidase [Candidatus Phytoplasma meliae]|uniref:M42 family metallopeptidase n=1 Tax=Candidatus Phytoplasma meliae TaxID=1848402 RepID=A0ABS5CYX0_9MOLU|nr:M42 family metallopeptidase [Candidatus Phytoplasma meliae]MBP5835811.1 M42 family metallopeptidase [Candidatus Phytoplasma meliae]MBP5836178.1 M42 family metallopeptidase [Candidatus Phytoplasma meliae]
MSDLVTLLKDLSMLNGIPGQEKEVSKYVVNQIKNKVDAIEYDNLGSVIASKGASGPRIMFAGHLDEIGLVVTQITPEGFLKFQTLGGWFSQVMLAQVWNVHASQGTLKAVTGCKPPHIMTFHERNRMVEISSMYLDIGVATKEEALKLGVRIGDMVTPYVEFNSLANSDYLLGKALDNRVGVAIIMQILANIKPVNNQFFGAFTVQEEVGLRGAKTSAHKIHPQIAIAVDTGIANDVPGGDKEGHTLGKGPQVLVYDGGLIAHRGLRKLVLEVAEKNQIPIQEVGGSGGSTDAATMHLVHEGAAALSLCVPVRYIHSHASIVHKQDIQNTIKLLTLLVNQLDETKIQEILFQ